MQQRWPDRLWVVRHGESAGNVAREAAHAAGLARLDIAQRDVDVPLSDLGERQSVALGRWFADQPVTGRPDVVMSSPYRKNEFRVAFESTGFPESWRPSLDGAVHRLGAGSVQGASGRIRAGSPAA
jgi:Histidine phosphatase superfamily (branch 1)